MRQSSSPSASSIVKAAALLMAAPALLLPMKAAAQQMASAQPDFSTCDRMSATNPKGAISCRVEVLNAHATAADQRGATARQEGEQALAGGQCLDRLIAGNRDGTLPKAVVVTTEPVVKANGKVSAANACAAEEAARRVLGRAASVQPAALKQ